MSESDFASGTSGSVYGARTTALATLKDAGADLLSALKLERRRLERAASRTTPRRVLALAVDAGDRTRALSSAAAELARSHHHVNFASRNVGRLSKWENLNALLEEHPPAGHDWLLVLDDDVVLPRGFLDIFLFLAERFDFRLAQPAHRFRSHAAWAVTRRQPLSLARRTGFVEIGPVFALHSDTFRLLLPFPSLRFGWGLDSHWGALAAANGWKMGIVDSTPVEHSARRIAASYDRDAAAEESRQFLEAHPGISPAQAQRTLQRYSSWR